MIFREASLPGIGKVFDPHTTRAIMRLNAEDDSTTPSKGAVTMVFPSTGLVDCLLRLEIYPSEVEHLAMALFKTRIKSEDQIRHVCLKDGVILTPTPEITLSGVLDEAIAEVFGREIHEAVKACYLREKELKEGIVATKCILMILSNKPSDGAVIGLSLGLEEGVSIREELYPRSA